MSKDPQFATSLHVGEPSLREKAIDVMAREIHRVFAEAAKADSAAVDIRVWSKLRTKPKKYYRVVAVYVLGLQDRAFNKGYARGWSERGKQP